jgi:hypothetical protein
MFTAATGGFGMEERTMPGRRDNGLVSIKAARAEAASAASPMPATSGIFRPFGA